MKPDTDPHLLEITVTIHQPRMAKIMHDVYIKEENIRASRQPSNICISGIRDTNRL